LTPEFPTDWSLPVPKPEPKDRLPGYLVLPGLAIAIEYVFAATFTEGPDGQYGCTLTAHFGGGQLKDFRLSVSPAAFADALKQALRG
jgi:hypothetical protein